MNICIVHYIYINPKANWKCIVGSQIKDLKDIGLFDVASVHCVLCGELDLIEECKNFINESKIIYTSTTVNNYEYPGLLKLYQLGKENPECVFLYMHTKGMVFNNGNNSSRNVIELTILRNTIKYHRYIYSLFQTNKEIDKVGLFPDHSGIIWYNFFWIRGNFLKKLSEPIITPDRYYYEHKYIVGGTSFNLLTFDTTTIDIWFAIKNTFQNYKIFFNEKKYLAKYLDLSKNGITITTAYNHFINFGMNENRNLI